MTILRMEHVGIVVRDLSAAVDFFQQLGLVLEVETPVEGDWVGRIIGLRDVRADVAILRTPDGHGRVELTEFHSPPSGPRDDAPPANALGLRHVLFAVDDIAAVVSGLRDRGSELVGEVVRYEDSYLLCYVRGPEGIIVELAEKLG